ncbi:MAG: ubiquinone biosynthesis protein, partial [Spirulinaceae cyanobacterium SM2_1_0]|nr:ubiquinone biosynthesis protein [Spirulinaceae cyanobacterium SM2_1_0]
MKLLNFVAENLMSASEQQINYFQVMRLFKSWFALMVDGESLQPVYEMSEVLLEMPAFEQAAQHLKQDPDSAALIRDRYIPPTYDLDQLLTYPTDSLGYQFAAAMKSTGFDPNLHAGMTAESDARYVELRLSQTHDIWHIVTGFDTSEIGEIGLQAFHLPQFPYPLAAVLLANS